METTRYVRNVPLIGVSVCLSFRIEIMSEPLIILPGDPDGEVIITPAEHGNSRVKEKETWPTTTTTAAEETTSAATASDDAVLVVVTNNKKARTQRFALGTKVRKVSTLRHTHAKSRSPRRTSTHRWGVCLMSDEKKKSGSTRTRHPSPCSLGPLRVITLRRVIIRSIMRMVTVRKCWKPKWPRWSSRIACRVWRRCPPGLARTWRRTAGSPRRASPRTT